MRKSVTITALILALQPTVGHAQQSPASDGSVPVDRCGRTDPCVGPIPFGLANQALEAGVAEGYDGEITGFGGADLSAWLIPASADFPVDVIWTSGVGASFGRYFTAALPMGFSIGRVWSGRNAEFGPYVSARGVLEGRYGDDAPEEIFALDVATELGGELLLGSGRGILFRVAASFGDVARSYWA